MRRSSAVALLLALALPVAAFFVAREGARRAEVLLSTARPGTAAFPVVVEVRKGRSASAIARDLQQQGVVADARLLRAWLGVSGLAARIQAGEYLIERPMSAVELAELFVSGRVMLHAVTIAEGLTLEQAAARAAASGLWSEEDVLAAFRDPGFLTRDGIDPAATDLEGYLFPETYHFARGEKASALSRAMVSRFREVWNELGGDERARTARRTLREVVTLASIVEKETSLPGEHGLVASVYANRLRIGMKLDADPTVVYGMERQGAWHGYPVLIADLSYPSPYNTYLYAGLPPGPIASPGRASLAAALSPATSEHLYFVATGDGGHRFASTMREHEANVRDYRALMRDQRRMEREAAPPGAR